MTELYPYPRFSLAERDRRWKAVRDLMQQHRIDVIVTVFLNCALIVQTLCPPAGGRDSP
jgi:hypothetical protein